MTENQSPDTGIEVRLNGEPHHLAVDCTVSALVKSLAVEPTAVAVEINRTIVARSCISASGRLQKSVQIWLEKSSREFRKTIPEILL